MNPYALTNLINLCGIIATDIKNSKEIAPTITTLLNKVSRLEPDDRLAFKNFFLPNSHEKDVAETILNALLNSPNEEAKALGNEIKNHITPPSEKTHKHLVNLAPIRKKIVKPPLYAYNSFPVSTPAFPIGIRPFRSEYKGYTRRGDTTNNENLAVAKLRKE